MGYKIRCGSHTYITLEYDDKFICCYDNDMQYMEDIIAAIEKRTGMKFQDIPRKGYVRDFDGLRFLYKGFRKGHEIFPEKGEAA